MICKIFLLGLAGLALAGEPGVFDNYFDDTIKEVDISLDIAIKGCLQNGDTFADKVRKAYGDCFGSADYSFGELAANEGGKDSDNDGLPDSFEGNEKCFYKKIGWVDGAGKLSPDAIKGDLAGLGSGEKAEFDDNIDKCANWNGDFSSRRKRDVGENETEEEVSNVPSVMESGSSALGWLKAAVRKVRSAEPGNNGKKGNKNGQKNRNKKKTRSGKKKNNNPGRNRNKKNKNKTRSGKKKKKNNTRRGKKKNNQNRRKKPSRRNGNGKKKNKSRSGKKKKNNNRSGKKKKNNKNRSGKKKKKNDTRGGKKKKNQNRGKKPNRRNGNGKKNNNSNKKDRKKDRKNNNGGEGGKKGGKNSGNSGTRNNNGMEESTYNKLWCFDLSLEQILQKCVENKIKN